MKTRVERVTEGQLRSQIADILQRFPQLENFDGPQCCPCCMTERVRQEWGSAAADAWETLGEARWLLGED